MPRYHFNVHDGTDLPDVEGTELPSLDHARREAVRYSGCLLRDHADAFWTGEEWRMDVTDERGLILFSLMFVATNAPSTGSPRDRRPG